MHAFLIVSRNPKAAQDLALAECKKNQINRFDISLYCFEKAIGIEDIRNLQRQVNLKPIYSKTKAVILEGGSGITIEAQNALLKILEEPPPHTIIYITIPNKDLVFPTILSRCKIIELRDKGYELSKEDYTQHLSILMSLQSSRVGDRLKLAQDMAKNKDELIVELEKMIIVARNVLISSFWERRAKSEIACLTSAESTPESLHALHNKRDSGLARMTDEKIISQYLNLLTSLQKTHTILKTTNVNPRLALENLFLNL